MNIRPRIIICSLFKPVDDTRMYEKLAASLAGNAQFEIIIIGHSSTTFPDHRNIIFMPVFRLKRLSPSRLIAPIKLLFLLIKLKPKIIINNSADFLLIIVCYRFFFKSKIIYDIQENFYYNIRCNRYFPSIVRTVLANAVRLVEEISSSFIDYCILAEKTFADELPFIRSGRFVILENKYSEFYSLKSSSLRPINNQINILYSGTIAEHYGIFDIINFIKGFHELYKVISLIIIGFCPHKPTFKRLLKTIQGHEFIHMTGGDKLVPHREIIESVQMADFGIINYHINPSTELRMPTRLYEYMANKLPVLIKDHNPWSDYVLMANAGVIIDFKAPDYSQIYKRLISNNFYSDYKKDQYCWSTEKTTLINTINELIAGY